MRSDDDEQLASRIYVRDQDKSLRFYLDQLGFGLVFDARLQTGCWVGVAPPDGTAVLSLIAPDPLCALLMANLQANLRSQCAIARDRTGKLLQSVNQVFCDNTPDHAYATLFFAEYDDQQRRLSYANCGHPCGCALRKSGAMQRIQQSSSSEQQDGITLIVARCRA